MRMMSIFPFLIVIFYLAITLGILYLIYRWVSKFISLKQEHNDLLREIIQKMESK